jgi:hypothetical protein
VANRARAALAKSITPANIAREVEYQKSRKTFERPYGLAWVLQLGIELREMKSPQGAVLEPLETIAVERVSVWLPKLSHPVRTGEHNQTAFSLGLMLDHALHRGDAEFRRLLEERARRFFEQDRNGPIGYEPSGHDFLSPCLAEADVMRRVLEPEAFAAWFDAFLPSVFLKPTVVTDPADGQLAHLDGLNLSRAWMLEGIASALPAAHPSAGSLADLARQHRQAGLAAVSNVHYEGAHWLGSFAMYLASGRGLR